MNTSTNQARLNRLKDTLNILKNKLVDTYESKGLKASLNDMDAKELVIEIKKAEKEIKKLELKSKLDRVNKTQKEYRNFLSDFLKIEKLVTEDIFNNDGTIHSTKLKKLPLLAEFMDKYKYARFEFQDNNLTSVKYYDNSFVVRTYKYIGSYLDQNKEYSKLMEFNEVLKYNGIKAKNLTLSGLLKNIDSMKKRSEKINATLKKHNESMNNLDFYFLDNNGLINSDIHRNTVYKIY